MLESYLSLYRKSGAAALRDQLEELVRKAFSKEATKSFRHFVADVCMDLKEHEEAIDILRIIQATDQLDDAGYNNMAFCYWELGREKEAYSAYKQSLALNAGNASSLRGACYLGIEGGHNEEAVKCCRLFFESSSEDREAMIWYATALHNMERRQELRELVNRWESRFGPDPEVRRLFGDDRQDTP